MSEVKIDDNIPIPERRMYTKTKNRNVLDLLDVGQSLLVPNPDNLPLDTIRHRINSNITYIKKTTGKDFTTRTTIEGLRVWRIK